jgi:hypothetical protein
MIDDKKSTDPGLSAAERKTLRSREAEEAIAEHESAQKAFHENRERLREERLRREAAAGPMLYPAPELPDDTPVENVRFATRIRNALNAAGLKTIGDVREVTLPSAHREVIDVLRTGPQEIEEVDVLTLTGLADTQQNKGVAKAFLRGKPVYHAAKQCECLHGVLRIIVVPWDIVEIQKSKHLIAIFLQAIDELACSLTGIIVNETFIESINRIPKLAQEAFLEAASVHRFNYRLHHAGEIRSELL